MKKSLLLLLLLPSPAPAAATYCESIQTIRAKVNYCDENTAYVAPAQACRDKFKAAVKAKEAELRKILDADLKRSKGGAQDTDFADVVKALGDTEKVLDGLIQQGQQLFAEIDAYQEDFVLPVYPGYEDDFKKDIHDPKVQREFRSSECYGEAMDDIDIVKAEAIKILDDLGNTKEVAKKLRGLSQGKQGNLGGQGGKAADGVKGESGRAAPAGAPAKNGASDITGTEESKRKEQAAPGGQ